MPDTRVIYPEPDNQARRTPMPSRAFRRERVRELRRNLQKAGLPKRLARERIIFRPVYGHAIPAPDHKETIAALKWGVLHKKNCTCQVCNEMAKSERSGPSEPSEAPRG